MNTDRKRGKSNSTAFLVCGSILRLSSVFICVHLWLIAPQCTGEEIPTKLVRLTKDGGFKQHLQWSPDGKRFLMTRIHEGKMALWTMNADGSDLKKFLNPEANTVHFDGHWSSDNKQIVFVLDALKGTDGNLQI